MIDIFVMSYKVIKQVSLPDRKRKGNLLSSIFNFFIAIIERLNFFGHGFLSIAALFRKKYIKQTIFFIGGILFFLSLFEWTGDQRLSNKVEITSTEQLPSNVEITITKTRQVNALFYEECFNKTHPEFHSPFNSSFTYSLPVEKFLLIRSLRI